MKRLNQVWPILVIVIVWAIFSSPYLVHGLVPFPSKYLVTFFPPWAPFYAMPVKNNAMPDVITQIYPWKKLTVETWKSGLVPLWNPFSFSGTPHAANYQTAVFSPFNLLFWVLAQVDAWSILILLQPLLAGLFMYLFLRGLACSRTASLLGSLAFSWCGFMVVWMAYGTLGYAALFLPLMLWAVQRAFNGSFWKHAIILSLSTALSFVSGHFQISVYALLFTLAYLAFTSIKTRNWSRGIRLGIFIIIGLGLSLPQLLPSYAAYLSSVRSASFVKGEIIPWRYLLTLVAPDFYGNPVTRNDWFGHYAEWAGYIGVVPLLLAVYAVIGRKKSTAWFFLTAGLVALLLALPTPLADLLFFLKLPAISTSAASRIIVLVSFSLAVLSSFGLDTLVSDWKKGQRGSLKMTLIVVAVFVCGTWLYLLLGGLPADKLAIARRNFVMPSALLLLGAVMLAAGFLKKIPASKYLAGGLVLLAALDLLRFAVKWMPFEPKAYVYPELKLTAFLKTQIGYNRVFGNLSGEFGNYFGIPLIEGYDALYQARYGEFISSAADGTIKPAQRSVVLLDRSGKYSEDVLRLLGVRYLVHRTSDGRSVWAYPFWNYPNYRQIYRDENFEVYENTQALPRVFLASSYRLESAPSSIVKALWDPQLDRGKTLILEDKPLLEPAPGQGGAVIIAYLPTRVEVETQAGSAKLLFLSDVYDAGWQAYLDGTPVPILRADYDFRAVAVPAGVHRVRFRYEPPGAKWGLRIAASVALLLVLVGVGGVYYDHRLL